MVLWDSHLIATHMVYDSNLMDSHMPLILDRDGKVSSLIEKVNWFQIIYEHNGLVDFKSNSVVKKKWGVIQVNNHFVTNQFCNIACVSASLRKIVEILTSPPHGLHMTGTIKLHSSYN